jgi:hypothetical protein
MAHFIFLSGSLTSDGSRRFFHLQSIDLLWVCIYIFQLTNSNNNSMFALTPTKIKVHLAETSSQWCHCFTINHWQLTDNFFPLLIRHYIKNYFKGSNTHKLNPYQILIQLAEFTSIAFEPSLITISFFQRYLPHFNFHLFQLQTEQSMHEFHIKVYCHICSWPHSCSTKVV